MTAAEDPIVIVGGGVVGTSVAGHLQAAERDVVLFERERLGAGTTGDSIAMFTVHQEEPDPVEHRLRERARDYYEPLVDDGTLSYERVGTLHTAESTAGMAEVEDLAATLESFGAETDLLDPEELDRFGIDPDAVRGALYLPDEGYLDPTEIVRHFVSASTATVETDVAVTDVVLEDGSVAAVETTDGRVDASAVVNAAGPWAHRVNGMAGVSLPLRHTLGPIVVLEPPAAVTLPLTFFEAGYYLREEGRTRALAGRFSAAYEDAERLDPDHSVAVDEAFYLAVEELVSRTVPSLAGAEVVGDWMGTRTVTPDGRPFVGETSVPGFYVACGMSGYGITRAPVVGEVLAGTLLDRSDEDLDELLAFMSPSRV